MEMVEDDYVFVGNIKKLWQYIPKRILDEQNDS